VLDDRQYVYQATSDVNGRTADEVIELQDPFWGRVRLERWNGLHEKRGADVPYDVIRASEAGDRWTELTALACWLLFLARPTVEDTPLPWQRSQQRLTPSEFSTVYTRFLSRLAAQLAFRKGVEMRQDGRKVCKEHQNNKGENHVHHSQPRPYESLR